MSCGVGHRHGLDLVLLWLWCRPAAAAPIGPLAWEPPCATGVALKRKKKKLQFLQTKHVGRGNADQKGPPLTHTPPPPATRGAHPCQPSHLVWNLQTEEAVCHSCEILNYNMKN